MAPFASVLLRSESAASSMIENLTSGAKAIALAELGSAEKRNATEIIDMHAALLNRVESGPMGQRRTEQVWIGGDVLRSPRSMTSRLAPVAATLRDRQPCTVVSVVPKTARARACRSGSPSPSRARWATKPSVTEVSSSATASGSMPAGSARSASRIRASEP